MSVLAVLVCDDVNCGQCWFGMTGLDVTEVRREAQQAGWRTDVFVRWPYDTAEVTADWCPQHGSESAS